MLCMMPERRRCSMRKVKLYDTLFRCRYVLCAGDFDAEIEVPAYYIDWLMCGFLRKLRNRKPA